MATQRIKIYQGNSSECSYLEERQATHIYADPHHPELGSLYSNLIEKGFRRSGEYVYRTGCQHCNACVPVRIKVDHFKPRRTDKRNLKRNSRLQVSYKPAQFDDTYFELYLRYLQTRHKDGGMDNPEPEDFERFLLTSWGETLFVTVHDEQKLVAVAVTDVTVSGFSAVYTFFDPDYQSVGLGRFCILQQIELCRSMSLPYLYLGYWIAENKKMQYKTEFAPQEHFNGHDWVEFTPTT